MKKHNTRQRLLDLVLVRLGWKETALRLEVSAQIIDAWMNGTQGMPDEKLVHLVDLIDETSDS